jgi:hypothetical protein
LIIPTTPKSKKGLHLSKELIVGEDTHTSSCERLRYIKARLVRFWCPGRFGEGQCVVPTINLSRDSCGHELSSGMARILEAIVAHRIRGEALESLQKTDLAR